MYNEEEIEDSLEFCRDIDTYYEKKDTRTSYEAYMKSKKRISGGYSSFKQLSANGFSGRNSASDWATRSYDERIEEEEQDSLFQRLLSGAAGLMVIVFLAYGISSFLTNYCIWNTEVDGISMEPALDDGDRLLIDKFSYNFMEPERFDIIVFPQDLDVYYVKRIIGLPGETIQIKDGKIYVDDIVLVENYGNEPISEDYFMEEPVVLGEGEYFVLGDNRNHSIDSRDTAVGKITRNHIIGKVWVKFYPLKNMKFF